MKKAILTIAALLTANTIFAQTTTCPSLKLKDGMKLTYGTKTRPPKLYQLQADYYKKSEKEKLAADMEFLEQNPFNSWHNSYQISQISLSNNSDGSTRIRTTVQRGGGSTAEYFAYFKNDTLVNEPGFVLNNNGTITTTSYRNKIPNGYNLLYPKSTPNKLAIGQLLPDQQISFLYTGDTSIVKMPKPKK